MFSLCVLIVLYVHIQYSFKHIHIGIQSRYLPGHLIYSAGVVRLNVNSQLFDPGWDLVIGDSLKACFLHAINLHISNFFEPVSSQCELSHQWWNFTKQYCSFYFFGPRSIFPRFRFRHVHVRPNKMLVADSVTLKTFNMADCLIVFVSQNVLSDKREKTKASKTTCGDDSSRFK